jgi:hypothetical protein
MILAVGAEAELVGQQVGEGARLGGDVEFGAAEQRQRGESSRAAESVLPPIRSP